MSWWLWFRWIFDEFWHCNTMFGPSHSASFTYRKTSWNLLKPLRNLFFGRYLRKISICFGNWPIADFFHDQTIFLKDYELYIIGHSLDLSNVKIMTFSLELTIFFTQNSWREDKDTFSKNFVYLQFLKKNRGQKL